MNINDMLFDKNEIIEHLKKESFNGHSMQYLRDFIRKYYDLFTSETLRNLVNLYVLILKNSRLKMDEKVWATENSCYFAGNVNLPEDDCYRQLFKSKKYTLSDLINFTEYISDNLSETRISYYLRNAEVTIRDDVNIIDVDILIKTCIEVVERETNKYIK